MVNPAERLNAEAWSAVGGDPAVLAALSVVGEGALPSAFAVTDFAVAAVGAASLAVAQLVADGGGALPPVTVDRRLASFWFAGSIRPVGWEPAPPWDPIAGDYKAEDGWIRLHTNAPHHRAAAETVLGVHPDKASMAAAVAPWGAQDLESAVVAAGGCAAQMRKPVAWAQHPQGVAVNAEPVVDLTPGGPSPVAWTPAPGRPLAGLKVLDLTRILAGPVATRFLAGYGADVLRIDPPGWNEPGVEPEVTLGKRCARIDLRDPEGRAAFEALLSGADILVHGYRPGALEGLGYGEAARRALAPGLVEVALCAYGWTGPWAGRRGFDSLVQMSAGIAEAGMGWKGSDKPTPLPVQALDLAAGYLMAAAAVRGVSRRLLSGQGSLARLSLARMAKMLVDAGDGPASPALAAKTDADFIEAVETTAWGPALRLKPPSVVAGAPAVWDIPARKLGWAEAGW